MFRSRSTYQEYLNSLQDEEGAPVGSDLHSNDIEDLILHSLDGNDQEKDDRSSDEVDLNIEDIVIPEGFNDNEEVLIIDGLGNAKIHKGRINVSIVYGLDAPNKILVPFNKFYQPIKKAGSIFNRFLSDVTRRPNLCPLNYKEWRLVPEPFKDRIMSFIQKKFKLPPGGKVRSKVLSSVGDRLRGYKRSLRLMYIKEDTTKEELYRLPMGEPSESEKLTRPKGVPDTMWYGFIDLCFSEKFKKYSEIGKRARAHMLHPHTSGSQSFAIKRDKYVKENQRDPGPIEWFQETHQTKDKTYHNVITKQFMDTAMKVVQQKTKSSEVVFSKSTMNAEAYAYEKLMGVEKYGRVRGFGTGVYSNDLRDENVRSQCDTCSLVLQKMQVMETWFQNFCFKKDNQQDGKHDISDEDDDVSLSKDDENVSGDFTPSKNNLLHTRGDKENLHVNILDGNEDKSCESPNKCMKVRKVGIGPKVQPLLHQQKESQHLKIPLDDLHQDMGKTSFGRRDMLKDMSNVKKDHIFSNNGDHVDRQTENGTRITMPSKCSLSPSSFSKIHKDQAMYSRDGYLGYDIDGGRRIPLQMLSNGMSQRVLAPLAPSSKQSNRVNIASENLMQHTNHGNEESICCNTSLSSKSCQHLPFTLRNQVDLKLNNFGSSSYKEGNQLLDKQCQSSKGARSKEDVSDNICEKRNTKRQKQTLNQMSREEIHELVNKVLKENPGYVNRYHRGDKREFVHCYLVGMVVSESKRRANEDIVADILWEKLDNFKFLKEMKATTNKSAL